MKLKSLRVHGFKSFADSTQVDFHDGITAIVGPNGCGKSNIKDAIRWVLGEQRPTAIRGARMEEAIFQGSVSRRPVNRGSVSMVVTNDDGALPVPFEEVEIGRTIYRDGGSDYQLNRSTCRLKDVVDLCRDTGLGANAYSVIENRMIDAILSDRADERRALFEEAAGIGKYKDRRKSALRRLETAEVDLQRLEDVIAEVQTKVRSLARQKGKAQRYEELRARRLSVEVEVVRHELDGLGSRLGLVEKELAGDLSEGQGVTAQLQAAEVELEGVRIRHVQAEKARSEAAAALDAVRGEAARVEKDLAVANERVGYAARRLEQIAGEDREARELVESAAGELTALGETRDAKAGELEKVQAELEKREARAAEVRGRLQAARAALEAASSRNREVVRRVAQLEGDREAALAQVEELGRRFDRLSGEIESGADALSELRSQGDLFSDRRLGLKTQLDTATAHAEQVRSRLAILREEFKAARTHEMSMQSGASSLRAEHAAVKRLVDSREGSGPVVAAALKALPTQVLGTLADFVTVAEGRGPVVDSVFGSFGLALVVKDMEATRTLSRWYQDEWSGGGSLVVLPLDRAPQESGPLPEGVEATGEGAPWVKALLGSLEIAEVDGLLAKNRVFAASSAGVWVDRLGAIHLGDSSQHGGLLERKERLEKLTEQLATAEADLEASRTSRTRLEEELRSLEQDVEAASTALMEAKDEYRTAEMEATAQTDRRNRLDKHQEELTRQLEGTRAARDRSLERSRAAESERETLVEEESGLQAAVEAARLAVAEVDQEWEEARSAESQMTIEAAGLGHELDRVTSRISDLTAARARAAGRIEALGREAKELTEDRARLEELRKGGAERLQELFSKRDEAARDLQSRDQELSEAASSVNELERRVREIRAQERQAVDRRHQLELEQQDIKNQVDRIRDRLETEWGRPLEALLEEAEPVEGEPDLLREELREIVIALDRLGPVNMLAVEEHAEESERLDYLVQQREDLVTARDDLRSAIRQINETATELFLTSFHAVRENFQKTFQHLFRGGEADLWLADPENPLESPVEIHASPVGKTTQRIDLLSGGERALTALSLLFGIYLVKPSPFCVLDEVDAPLDESNISRFIRLLQQFKDQTQFICITHNPRTIEAADWIYGVTMEEPGVSTIVGVRLQEALEATGNAA